MASIKPFTCSVCNQGFARKDGLKRHSAKFHSNLPLAFECLVCGLVFKEAAQLRLHRKTHSSASKFEMVASGLRGVAKNYRYKKSWDEANVKVIQKEVTKPMIDTINNELSVMLRAKVNIVFATILAQLNEIGETTSVVEYLIRSKNVEVFRYSDHRVPLHNCFEEIQRRVEDFQANGSAYFLAGVEYVGLEFSECRALAGSCGNLAVTYQKDLFRKQIEIGDGTCFYRAVAAHFVGCEDKKKLEKFLVENVNMIPVDKSGFEVKDIEKFEKMNEHLDLKINLLYQENKNIFPIRIAKGNAANKINLMLIKMFKTKESSTNHYVLVKDLSKLVRQNYSNGYENTEVCENCFSKFSRKSALLEHQEHCYRDKPQEIILGQKGEHIKFTNTNKKYKAPFIGFLDLETVSKKVNKCMSEDCQKDDSCPHKSSVIAEQEPISFCIIFLDHNEKIIF